MMKSFIFAFVIGALACSAMADSSPSLFSRLPAVTLSKDKLQIPEDLADTPVLFIVGFSKASRAQTRPWSQLLEQKYPTDKLVVYNVSVIQKVPRLIRGIVIRAITKDTPQDLHDRFLLVTQRAKDWQALAAYSAPDAAYLILINKAHQVVWHFSGPASAANLRLLTDEIAELPTDLPDAQ